MDHFPCECACGVRQFHIRLFRDERVGLLTCKAGHHSLLLDSRDYWIDVLQDGRPEEIPHGVEVEKQPQAVVEFAHHACEWLRQNYVSERGKKTADNAEEYSRFAQLAANPRRS
jgi:hypothetical protein